MNKRQIKKRNKKADMWVRLDTTPFRCLDCEYYESGDMSVGLPDGCVANYLYDDSGEFRDDMNDKAVEYMERKGWTCPYFSKTEKTKKYAFKAPKNYKEIKERIKAEKEYYRNDY